MAKAAGRLLEIESGEILAEYRPALTADGAAGLEAEIFIYDTLAGGVGFSTQLAAKGEALIEKALQILEGCPEGCDCIRYRCLRNFRNKLDHRLLDRKLGEQLLRHAKVGGYPGYPPDRVQSSLRLLCDDLRRQFSDSFDWEMNVPRRSSRGHIITLPIVATRRIVVKKPGLPLAHRSRLASQSMAILEI